MWRCDYSHRQRWASCRIVAVSMSTSPATRLSGEKPGAPAAPRLVRSTRDVRPPLAAQRGPITFILSTLALINVLGLPYYRLSQGERVRSPLHAILRPSGAIGQSAGILALLIFFFLWRS